MRADVTTLGTSSPRRQPSSTGLAVSIATVAVVAVVGSPVIVDRIDAALFVPYLTWVSYAAALTLSIAVSN